MRPEKEAEMMPLESLMVKALIEKTEGKVDVVKEEDRIMITLTEEDDNHIGGMNKRERHCLIIYSFFCLTFLFNLCLTVLFRTN
jgi:hypothetical protein